MRDLVRVATRFLQTRKEWIELGRRSRHLTLGEAMRMSFAEAEMRALAWVLDVALT